MSGLFLKAALALTTIVNPFKGESAEKTADLAFLAQENKTELMMTDQDKHDKNDPKFLKSVLGIIEGFIEEKTRLLPDSFDPKTYDAQKFITSTYMSATYLVNPEVGKELRNVANYASSLLSDDVKSLDDLQKQVQKDYKASQKPQTIPIRHF